MLLSLIMLLLLLLWLRQGCHGAYLLGILNLSRATVSLKKLYFKSRWLLWEILELFVRVFLFVFAVVVAGRLILFYLFFCFCLFVCFC